MKITECIGDTPMVKIKNIYGSEFANVYVKMEELNPGGSVKSRVGIQMIKDAEEKGLLSLGSKIIEPTGGNTGLGLALAASIKGYRLTLVIPDNFSQEKIKTLKKYNAEIVLSDHTSGPGSHVRLVKEMIKKDNSYVYLDQFSNESNPNSHYLHTGVEILEQTSGNVDAFVAGIGSGGTVMGVGKRLKEHDENIKIFGVQPKGCDFFNEKFITHKIEAISVGVVSSFIDKAMIDEMLSVEFDEVEKFRDYLSKEEGLFVGISSGANILASLKLSKRYSNQFNIVTIAPDSGRSYM